MDIKDAVKAYKSGKSLDWVAEALGVCRATARKRIASHTKIRKPGRSDGRSPLGPEWKLLGKIPDAVLAKKLGCSRQNVSQTRRAHGIPSYREKALKDAGITDAD